jgi:hypothetical protein
MAKTKNMDVVVEATNVETTNTETAIGEVNTELPALDVSTKELSATCFRIEKACINEVVVEMAANFVLESREAFKITNPSLFGTFEEGKVYTFPLV